MPAVGTGNGRRNSQMEGLMTNPGNDYDAQHAQPVDAVPETEAERVARQQKEVQAANGETTETRNAGSMNAQNTPGPETQGR